jgi:hypothetical protein
MFMARETLPLRQKTTRDGRVGESFFAQSASAPFRLCLKLFGALGSKN